MKTKKIQRVALVGGGVIGSGWATRCLAHGLSVVVTDPSPAAAEMVLKTVDSAWPILEQAGLDEKAAELVALAHERGAPDNVTVGFLALHA